MYTQLYIYIHACICAFMHVCMFPCILAYINTCIHAYMHTYIHANIILAHIGAKQSPGKSKCIWEKVEFSVK